MVVMLFLTSPRPIRASGLQRSIVEFISLARFCSKSLSYSSASSAAGTDKASFTSSCAIQSNGGSRENKRGQANQVEAAFDFLTRAHTRRRQKFDFRASRASHFWYLKPNNKKDSGQTLYPQADSDDKLACHRSL
ncbi:uncharacterized protein UDID_17980 [Ustilago sp. UG-2017a]|nr:uncharacterized protein UDID_17980 [Ustilago sp. UG-2017a]